jgi:hypothetical protein
MEPHLNATISAVITQTIGKTRRNLKKNEPIEKFKNLQT